MASQYPAPQLRSLYRRLLRELPARRPSNLADPNPIQQRIRGNFTSVPASKDVSPLAIKKALQSTEQFVQYLKAQRQYMTLIERYNPGMNMKDDDRIRLTARRVGMNLPEEYVNGGGDKSGQGGGR